MKSLLWRIIWQYLAHFHANNWLELSYSEVHSVQSIKRLYLHPLILISQKYLQCLKPRKTLRVPGLASFVWLPVKIVLTSVRSATPPEVGVKLE
jgi:hypothetical protein